MDGKISKKSTKKIKIEKKTGAIPKRKIKSEENIVVPSSLLLAYTYFFNNTSSKAISVGYNTDDFSSSVLLKQTLNGSILLSGLEWYSLFVKFAKINEYLKTEDLRMTENLLGLVNEVKDAVSTKGKKNVFKLSSTLFIKIDQDGYEQKIIFVRHKNSHTITTLMLSQEEWRMFYYLSEFINAVVTHIRSAGPLIQSYFESYATRCKELNVCSLDSSKFFVPQNTNYFNDKAINYSRLFFELPILCQMKINNFLYVSNINCNNDYDNNTSVDLHKFL